MYQSLQNHIEYLLCVNIENVSTISGGDISEAFLLETESERFFCKLNRDEKAYEMFSTEKAGLEAIAETKTIAVPRVLLCEALEVGGLLLMEYIEPKNASAEEMALFGHHLAALHSQTVPRDQTVLDGPSEKLGFGWKTDNFIGSLPQSNRQNTDWSKFWVVERLLPQIRFAREHHQLRNNEIPSEERLLENCGNLFPEITPALLHGDLWSGNYLISSNGIPYLIDPATYYGHREVDIAMSRLFGGFGQSFYDAYSEHFPKVSGEAERTKIYQLYYLLVHLNLLGASYKASVTSILNRYF